jgi:hypothetical protein
MNVLTQNIGLIGIAVVFLFVVIAMIYKDSVLDFVKANFGVIVLVTMFSLLLAVAFHVFHEANANPASKDFLAWLEQKAGEVLAAVLTAIVTVRATNGRSSDGNGKVPPPVTRVPTSPDAHP